MPTHLDDDCYTPNLESIPQIVEDTEVEDQTQRAGKHTKQDASAKGKTVVFQVKGFSCITCAVGLDTMYSRTKGILSSHSTYPEGKVTVRFDPGSIDDAAVRAVITDAGFTIDGEHAV